jgi:predicted acyltransferase
MVKVDFTAKFLFGWIAGIIGGRGGELAIVIGTILLSWSLLYYMYNKKIFLKI